MTTFRINLLNDRKFFGIYTAIDTLLDLFGPENPPKEFLMSHRMIQLLTPRSAAGKKNVDLRYLGIKCDSAGLTDWYIQAEYENGVRIGLQVRVPSRFDLRDVL